VRATGFPHIESQALVHRKGAIWLDLTVNIFVAFFAEILTYLIQRYVLASLGMVMLLGQLVGPQLWHRLSYLNNNWMDCHEIWYNHLGFREVESLLVW